MALKTYFEQDNFDSRRTTGHNMFDPESLITGYELAHGFTYANSHRDYPGQHTYDAIVAGDVPMALVPLVAPRVFNEVTFFDEFRDAPLSVIEAARIESRRLAHAFHEYEERTI